MSRKGDQPCAVATEKKIKYIPIYALTNCHNSCRMRAAMAICNCVPWQFAPFTKIDKIPVSFISSNIFHIFNYSIDLSMIPYIFFKFLYCFQMCGFPQLRCIRKNYKNIWSVMFGNITKDFCVCPEACQSGEFVIKHTEISLVSSPFTPSPV